MASTYYACEQVPRDALEVDVDKHHNTVFVLSAEDGVLLNKEDALDLARRINEAFGDGNA